MEYLEIFIIVSCSLFSILFCFLMIDSVISDAIKRVRDSEASAKDKISEAVAAFFMVLFFAMVIYALILIVNKF